MSKFTILESHIEHWPHNVGAEHVLQLRLDTGANLSLAFPTQEQAEQRLRFWKASEQVHRMSQIEKIETRALLRFWAKYLVSMLNDDDPASIYGVIKTLDRLRILAEKLELDLDKDE